jgi:hypothetical protein
VAGILLLSGTGPSPWSTYVIVGMVIAILGVIVFFLAGGLHHPTTGIVEASFFLSLFVMGLGIATALAGLGVRYWAEHRSPTG